MRFKVKFEKLLELCRYGFGIALNLVCSLTIYSPNEQDLENKRFFWTALLDRSRKLSVLGLHGHCISVLKSSLGWQCIRVVHIYLGVLEAVFNHDGKFLFLSPFLAAYLLGAHVFTI